MSDSREKVIEEMRQQKEEYVDSIAEESDIKSEQEREIIRQALDEKIITEEFADVQIEKDKIGPSLLDDIKHTIGSKGASRSRAKVSSVHVNDDEIEIEFDVIGVDDKFSEYFGIPESDTISEELKNIFILTGTEINNPNELKGGIVPIKPSNSDGSIEYEMHEPPEQLGVSNKIKYKLSRIVRRLELIRYSVGDYNQDVYTPTGRTYIVMLSMALLSMELEPFGGVLIFLSWMLLMLTVFAHLESRG